MKGSGKVPPRLPVGRFQGGHRPRPPHSEAGGSSSRRWAGADPPGPGRRPPPPGRRPGPPGAAPPASISASSAPTTTILWESWATEEAQAPRRKPKPCTRPSPRLPVPWWRSTTASFRRSWVGSATRRPARTGAGKTRFSVSNCPGIRPMTLTRSPAAAGDRASSGNSCTRKAVAGTGASGKGRLDQQPAAVHHQFAVFKDLIHPKILEVGRHHQVGLKTRGHRAPIPQAKVFRRVQGRHDDGWQGVEPQGYRLFEQGVQMAGLKQILRVAVIGDQHGAPQTGGSHRGQQVRQVLGQAAFPQHQVKTQGQLFPGLSQLGAFVVGADPGQPVGIKSPAGQERRMAVHRPLGEQGELLEESGLTADYPGKIHDLGQAQDPGVPAVSGQVRRGQDWPRRSPGERRGRRKAA